MNSIISENKLISYLETIRKKVRDIDISEFKNIVFLSSESFFYFIDNRKGKSVQLSELLNKIEHYIPLAITEENINLLLNAALDPSGDKVDALESSFIASSKIKFVNTIIDAHSPEQWNEIVNTCKTIRKYHVSGK